MKKNLTFLLTMCLIAGLCSTSFAGADTPASDQDQNVQQEASGGESAEGESTDGESDGESEAGESPDGESAEGESAEGESDGESSGYDIGVGTPDTSLGGRATASPPDNSTKAIDLLGSRAAVYFAYTDDGYTVLNNTSASYTVENTDIAVPVVGTNNAISGLYISCDSVDWDSEAALGNSGLIFNDLTDTETTFSLGGAEDLYDAPDGNRYNSVIVMNVKDDEEYDKSATETAPGVGIGFNGKALSLNNVYVEAGGSNRPCIVVPSSYRDKNVKQNSNLIVSDSSIINHSTRAMLLMGGDVWFLNSTAISASWGALSFDMTAANLYLVNSLAEQTGSAYAIYDAAGCNTYLYGSRIVSGGAGVQMAREATLTVANIDEADETATAPYEGSADLISPTVTNGRTEIIGYSSPIKVHADMAGATTQAVADIKDAYLSSAEEDVVFSETQDFEPSGASGGRSGSEEMRKLIDEYQNGAIAVLSCHSGKIILDNCELNSRSSQIVHSFFNYDPMASGIYPVDGAEYVGDEVVLRNMNTTGDILHDDYMRKMLVSLENTTLTGSIYGTTLTGWNTYWKNEISKFSGDESDLQMVIHDETYETLWGIRMSMDAASTWNVSGTSQLYSFTMEDGATVQPAEGHTMTIYVDCTMDNALESYDISAGTQIDAFEAGVEYSGVVIVVE